MAFVRNPLKDDGDQSSGVIGTDGQPITDAPGASPARPVSNWTNLENYVQGNQGAGSQIADKMLEQGNADVSAANNAGASFAEKAKKQVDDSTKKDAGWSDFFNKGEERTNQYTGQKYMAEGLSDASPEKIAAYNSWKDAPNYGGPQDAASADGYGDLQSATGKARDSAARSYTQDSQFALAKDSLGKGNQNYNGGMGMLDTILARQAGGGQKIDDFNTNNSAEKINERTKGVTDAIGGQIAAAKLAGDKADSDVKTALQGKLDKYAGQLNTYENSNKNSGDNAYLEDQNAADYANEQELAALNNIINGFGAEVDPNLRNDLLNKSGKSKKTVGEASAEEWEKIRNSGSQNSGKQSVFDELGKKISDIGKPFNKRIPIK
jgi:hypothetical protein